MGRGKGLLAEHFPTKIKFFHLEPTDLKMATDEFKLFFSVLLDALVRLLTLFFVIWLVP